MILKIDSTMYRLETKEKVDLELIMKVIKETIYCYEDEEGEELFSECWNENSKRNLIKDVLRETVGDYTLTEIKDETVIEF